jgi:hypothetical protein
MPQLGHLWLGTVTAGGFGSGTDSRIVLIINVAGDRMDNVHKTFPDTSQDDLEGDQANIYEVTQDEINTVTGFVPATVDTEQLNTSSIRIATRGSDAWRPKSIFVWGREEREAGEVVPLGLIINMRPSISIGGRLAGVTLSTNSSEGQVSFGVPRVTPGGASMIIRGLIVAMITTDEDDAGTDDLIRLRITTTDGRLVVDHSFTDTDQDDQEEGEANIYFVPVGTPFTKAELNDRSIELSIEGDDAWLPASFFLFGLAEELPASFSPLLEPLVHLATWPFGWMSTATSEGRASARLPLVPSPPVIP